MASVARFFIRGSHSKRSISGIGTGTKSSYGATLLKLSASCNACTNPQRRHVAHFTFQPDPVPTQYGEWLANRLTLSPYRGRLLKKNTDTHGLRTDLETRKIISFKKPHTSHITLIKFLKVHSKDCLIKYIVYIFFLKKT